MRDKPRAFPRLTEPKYRDRDAERAARRDRIGQPIAPVVGQSMTEREREQRIVVDPSGNVVSIAAEFITRHDSSSGKSVPISTPRPLKRGWRPATPAEVRAHRAGKEH